MAKTEEGGRGIVISFQWGIGLTKPSHKRVPSYKGRKESGLQSPPTRGFPPTKSERIGLTKPSHKRVPSYQRADSIRIGLTKPSHKRVPSYKGRKESGLDSPPTREFPPTKSERIGLTKPSHKRVPSYKVGKNRAYKALPQESSVVPKRVI